MAPWIWVAARSARRRRWRGEEGWPKSNRHQLFSKQLPLFYFPFLQHIQLHFRLLALLGMHFPTSDSHKVAVPYHVLPPFKVTPARNTSPRGVTVQQHIYREHKSQGFGIQNPSAWLNSAERGYLSTIT
jgi:hypothetical protein